MKLRNSNPLLRTPGLLGLCAITVSFLSAGSALAQTFTWSPTAATAAWDLSTNWSGGVAPTGTVTTLSFGGATTSATDLNVSGITTTNLNFTNILSSSNAVTLGTSGQSLTVSGAITTSVPTAGNNPSSTINADVILGSNTTITTGRANSSSGHTLTINGAITGAFSVTKASNGTLNLTNANNSFTGLSIGGASNSLVQVTSLSNSGSNSAIGSGSLINFSGGTLVYNGAATGGTLEVNRTISFAGGSGGLTNSGTGGATASGLNFSGAFTNAATGTRTLSLGGDFGITNINTVAGNVLNATNGDALGVFKTGASTWALTGSNNFTGLLEIQSGALNVGSISDSVASNMGQGQTFKLGNGTNTGALNFSGNSASTTRQLTLGANGMGTNVNGGGTINANGTNGGTGLKFTNTAFNLTTANPTSGVASRTLTLGGTNTDENTVAGVIMNGNTSVVTAITKTGTSRWILGGDNTYSGATAVSGGVLQLNHANAISGANLTLNGGVLGLGAGDFTRALGTGAGQVQITTAAISGFAAYGGDRAVNLGGASAGVTWITGGFFASGSNTMALSHATATHTLDFQNPIDLNAFTRTFDVANGAAAVDAKLSGALSGAVGSNFAKAGAGSLELTATNTYTGNTTVSAGTLIVSGSLPAGNVTVAGKLTGSGAVAGATSISSAGIYNAGNPNAAGGVGSQAFASTLAFTTGSIFEWDLNANSTSTGFDTVSATGNITVGAGSVFRVVLGTTAAAGLADTGNAFWNTPDAVRTWAMSDIFGKAFTTGSFTSVETAVAISPSIGAFTISGSNLTWTAVPEPSSALAGLLLGAGLLRRRRA
jgi:fibronectin-binding autotransporter adhesin